MARRGKPRSPGDSSPLGAGEDSASEVDVELDDRPAAVPAPAPAPEPKPLRRGLVRVRALKSCAIGGMPYYEGDVLVCTEEQALSRMDRGEVEPA